MKSYGPQILHTHDPWLGVNLIHPSCKKAAGSYVTLHTQECALLSACESNKSIDVNVLEVRTENINIKKANRTKFLKLHIKIELLQLKQQIKMSAEVFW